MFVTWARTTIASKSKRLASLLFPAIPLCSLTLCSLTLCSLTLALGSLTYALEPPTLPVPELSSPSPKNTSKPPDSQPIQTGNQRTFKQLDSDRDALLSKLEYAQGSVDKPESIRTFPQLDSNADGQLSRAEFLGKNTVTDDAPPNSDPNSDPFQRILQRAIEAMDESYDGWQYRPEETVDSTTFAINYNASISTDGQRRLDRGLILHADADRNRKITRDEAIRFLETQLGIRWISGDRLRTPDGEVIDFANFLRCDTNKDDLLTKAEFVNTWWNSETVEQNFESFDTDKNGGVNLAEFAKQSGPYLRSPVDLFRKADTNGDNLLDRRELAAEIGSPRNHLIESNLKAFDDDRDQKLSLAEFRVSMLANFNYPWEMRPKDIDRDGLLSYGEFKFHTRDLFQLQRRYYFHRLDRDGSKTLDPSEFDYEQYKLHSLYRISVNGENSEEIYRNEDFPIVSSPSVSPDGGWILFDAASPDKSNLTQILMMKSNGDDVRDVCSGQMPSWSGNGSRFACCRYEQGASIWIMNTNGTAHKRIDDGWAAQWSPDGSTIAYTNDNSVRLYDVASGSIRTLLAKADHPYQYIYWNMCWSPDSRQIVFKGKTETHQEISILPVSGPREIRKRFSTNEPMGEDLAWSPDGERILFNMYSPTHRRDLIFQLDANESTAPRLVPEINTSMAWSSICFSPNGKWMVLASPN